MVMIRTHLAITAFVILLFLTKVSNKIVFIAVCLIAAFLPDIDNGFSSIGKFQGGLISFISKHRGFFHSLTFCIIVSVVLAVFIPILAFPFFLGYSVHLLADSFTIEGIRPFWPLQSGSNWKIRTGSRIDTTLFITFVIVDILVFIFLVSKL